jgi:hypothetical protein
MALTTAQLIGSPAEGIDLNENIEIGVKATGVSSAIPVGRVAVVTAGVWAIATDGSTGRMGVIPNLDPINTDSDDTLQVATGIGSKWYVEFSATVKPGMRCAPSSGGKLKAYTAGDVTATPTEATIESAIKDFERAPFVYEGHYGEGSGLYNKPTDVTNGQAGRVKIGA